METKEDESYELYIAILVLIFLSITQIGNIGKDPLPLTILILYLFAIPIAIKKGQKWFLLISFLSFILFPLIDDRPEFRSAYKMIEIAIIISGIYVIFKGKHEVRGLKITNTLQREGKMGFLALIIKTGLAVLSFVLVFGIAIKFVLDALRYVMPKNYLNPEIELIVLLIISIGVIFKSWPFIESRIRRWWGEANDENDN